MDHQSRGLPLVCNPAFYLQVGDNHEELEEAVETDSGSLKHTRVLYKWQRGHHHWHTDISLCKSEVSKYVLIMAHTRNSANPLYGSPRLSAMLIKAGISKNRPTPSTLAVVQAGHKDVDVVYQAEALSWVPRQYWRPVDHPGGGSLYQ